MSGLVYHLVCSSCGRTSPTLELARDRSGLLQLPASNASTHELDVIETSEPGEPRDLALRLSTPGHPAAAVVVRGNELDVVPPLPCPRCAAQIASARWGSAPAEPAARATLDEMIAATRAATADISFTDRDERFDVVCEPSTDGGVHELTWRIRLRGDLESDRREELRALVEDLASRLKARGSAVLAADVRSQHARVTERFTR